MSNPTILFAVADGVATITLNRPAALNAFNQQMAEELLDAIARCASDPAVRAVVITGAGKGFCAGGDLKAMKQALDDGANPATFFQAPLAAINRAVLAIRQCPKPVMAAVNGPAAGAGMNLALACDVRLATEKARFTEAFLNVGLIPDAGGTFFLPRIVGLAKATELFLTGQIIDTAEAERLGIVHKVIPDAEFAETVTAWAILLAQRPTAAVGRLKALLNAGLLTDDLAAQLERERAAQEASAHTVDFGEGIRAFFEKRMPEFTGR